MELVEEHVKLTRDIVSGNINLEQVKETLERIECEYGPDSFDSYKVEKKSAPWTMEDLNDLEFQSISGACSKDFYLYMAEVSDYVHKDVKSSGFLGLVGKYARKLAEHWLIVLAVAGIVVALFFFLGNK